MPTGVLVGGWEYVWSAYGLSAAILLVYGLSLWLRWKSEQRRGEAALVPEEEW